MKSRKAGVIFAFITVLIDLIGVGIIIPVIPKLIRELSSVELSDAAGIGGWLMTSFALMQFLFSPLLGELSDKHGRRPILLIAIFFLAIDYVLHALAPTLLWLFIGRILAGMAGGSVTVATAYIADVSTPETKSRNFGLIGAAFGLGFIIGPIIGGIFGEYGARIPFWIAAGMGILNLLFGLFFVPESLPKEKRREIDYAKIIPGVSLFTLGKFGGFLGLLGAFFLANLAGQALPSTWTFFTIEQFGWSEKEIGYSLAAVGFLTAIVQGGLIGPLTKKFGQRKVIIFGFLLWCVGMFLFSQSVEPWMLYACLVPYALGGMAGPTLQALVSNKVSEKQQGILQGTMTSLFSITTIVGPLMAAQVFKFFTQEGTPFYFPGAPYVTSTALLIAATVLVIFSLRGFQEENPTQAIPQPS